MAFHPYPQLIRAVFNPQRFGPPPGVTPASSWPWIDRFGFGSAPTYSLALFRLAFASAPALKPLTSHGRSNSPDHNAKGTPSPAAPPKGSPGSDRLYAHGFRISFTRRQAFFSPFPHGTRPLSVTGSYLALEDGPPRFNRDSSCPGLLGCLTSSITRISPTGLSPPPVRRSRRVRLSFHCPFVRSHNPEEAQTPSV